MEAAFGGNESLDIQNMYEEVPDEEETNLTEEESETPSTSKGGKRKQTSLSSQKAAKSSKSGIFSLKNAEVYYPTAADEGTHLHAGVDPKYLSSRKSSLHTTGAGYGCLFSNVCK